MDNRLHYSENPLLGIEISDPFFQAFGIDKDEFLNEYGVDDGVTVKDESGAATFDIFSGVTQIHDERSVAVIDSVRGDDGFGSAEKAMDADIVVGSQSDLELFSYASDVATTGYANDDTEMVHPAVSNSAKEPADSARLATLGHDVLSRIDFLLSGSLLHSFWKNKTLGENVRVKFFRIVFLPCG